MITINYCKTYHKAYHRYLKKKLKYILHTLDKHKRYEQNIHFDS